MRIRGSRGVRLAGAAVLLLAAAPVGAQIEVVEIELPTLPIYGGATVQGLTGGVGDVATLLPKYFYRPMDDLTPRAGADALAMGGAFVSRPEGAMSMAWNPAGLGLLRSRSLAFDGYLTSSSGSMGQEDVPDTIFVPLSPNFRVQQYTDRLGPSNKFGFIGIARPLVQVGGHPLVGGLCYRRHTDVAYGTETILEMQLIEGTGFPFVYGSDNRERGAVYSYTFSLGHQPIETPGFSLALGATFNVLDGRLRAEQKDRVNVQGYPEGRVFYQADYDGRSAELGALVRVANLVQVGGWVGLPHTLHVTGSDFTSQSIVSSEEAVIYRVHARIGDYDLKVPMFLSGGLTVGPIDAGPIKALEVSADVNHRPWSETDLEYSKDAVYRMGPIEVPLTEFNGPYPMKDVTSFHVGADFRFPFFRRAIEGHGLALTTRLGFRTLPLSMAEVDLVNGEGPHYLGDQVDGDAFSLGLSLDTGIGVLFHGGMELQSYSFRKWFLDDTSESMSRTLAFTDPYARAGIVDRSSTVFRFSTELRRP